MTLHHPALALSSALGGPLLGVDTSTKVGSICMVGWGEPAVRALELDATALPSESLVSTLAAELETSGVRVEQLAGIVVGLGPGSFTGLRVSLATVKGLALGASVPVYGVSSLAVIAASHGPGIVGVAIDARRGKLFTALYRCDAETGTLLEDGLSSAEALVGAIKATGAESVRLVGDQANAVAALAPEISIDVVPEPAPRMIHGLLLAAARMRAGDADVIDTLSPRYAQLSEAERQVAAKLV